MSEIVTRFPPSPTGHLHLGGARTALFNFLFARHNRGKFILRFEDTDKERSKEEYVDSIIEALNWLGLHWDEGPYFQSKRLEIYEEYAKRLYSEGKAYYCECSKEELEAKRKAQLERGIKPHYDGTCREKGLPPGSGRALRIKIPEEITEIVFEDLLRGKIVFPPDEVDDFILLRSDGTPTYQFAVVIDDLTMGVTHVIRGDDHISNTPKQLMIYQALGAKPPQFAHIPMVLGPDGARLSKRHGARSILEYREEGYLPQAVLNYLARLGWGYGDQEYFNLKELIEKFDLSRVNLSPARFDPEKMLAFNAYWIKTLDSSEILKHLKPFLKSYPIEKYSEEYLKTILEGVKPRVKTLKEMAEMIDFYLLEEIELDEKAKEKYLTPKIKSLLERLIIDLDSLSFDDEKKLEEEFRALAEESGVKLKDLAQAVRVALTGKTISPPLFEVIKNLGKERVRIRLKKALEFIN
ncbi:MAG: glutamate--tRNA ligase [Caldimicrobium thiodismutans]|uniref:Glutamate--tRNA ligase n=1 Tax=Caldimicrobium thiodismutans TaxID=1653476 RepID=A0A2N7PIR1_9BACT|nr:MAG: glutamate--tRNA ligase [Caldimicrobium thiodismutans]